MTDCSFY